MAEHPLRFPAGYGMNNRAQMIIDGIQNSAVQYAKGAEPSHREAVQAEMQVRMLEQHIRMLCEEVRASYPLPAPKGAHQIDVQAGGTEWTVNFYYQPAESRSHDHPGYAEDIELCNVFTNGPVDVWKHLGTDATDAIEQAISNQINGK
jgi:hypothetical protein